MAVLDTFNSKWKIVAKRIIAEPTPRTPFQGPRFGIYDYDLIPAEVSDGPAQVSAHRSIEKPLIAFRKVRS